MSDLLNRAIQHELDDLEAMPNDDEWFPEMRAWAKFLAWMIPQCRGFA